MFGTHYVNIEGYLLLEINPWPKSLQTNKTIFAMFINQKRRTAYLKFFPISCQVIPFANIFQHNYGKLV